MINVVTNLEIACESLLEREIDISKIRYKTLVRTRERFFIKACNLFPAAESKRVKALIIETG